eukprot:TRINITY_DN2301_c0_g1_i2.p3 TRINITY_DN2301_c0_g1~~TRINITY_DN2301_c0_g1_i2.p3  ORF type:complete len:112 (-),score=5.73 TRINITY_DN2301_c0_g1_i2:88-423(-)
MIPCSTSERAWHGGTWTGCRPPVCAGSLKYSAMWAWCAAADIADILTSQCWVQAVLNPVQPNFGRPGSGRVFWYRNLAGGPVTAKFLDRVSKATQPLCKSLFLVIGVYMYL